MDDPSVKDLFFKYMESGGMLRDASHLFNVHRSTIWRWMKSRRPDPSEPVISTREAVIQAMQRSALEGNVPAGKLVLSLFDADPLDTDQLSVESAVELLRQWHSTDHCSGCPGEHLRVDRDLTD